MLEVHVQSVLGVAEFAHHVDGEQPTALCDRPRGEEALLADRALLRGTYLFRGLCVKESLARLFGLPHHALDARPA